MKEEKNEEMRGRSYKFIGNPTRFIKWCMREGENPSGRLLLVVG
jgi:hypothetical protein